MKFQKKYKFFFLPVIICLIFLISGILVLASWEPDLEQLSKEAIEAYYAGDLKRAVEKYEIIYQYRPAGKASLQLATIYEESGNYLLAIQYYKDYLYYSPDNGLVKLDLAIAKYNIGELAQAKKDLDLLLKSNPHNQVIVREAAYYLSKIAERSGDYQKALSYAEKALAADDKFALAAVQKGLIHQNMGNIKEAIESYLRGLRIDGSLKGVNRQLGLLYLKKEDYNRAFIYLEKALNENKKDVLTEQKLTWLVKEFPGRFTKISEPPKPTDLEKPVKFATVSPINNSQEITDIRIGLSGGKKQREVFFRVGSDFLIKNRSGQVIGRGKKGEVYRVVKKKNSYELILFPDGQPVFFSSPVIIDPIEYAPILIHQVQFGEGYYWVGEQDRQYRGKLELIPKEDGLIPVNILNVEEYLFSVVASEMPSYWPLEALKVQAVAARTYTFFNSGKHSKDGFDLCDSVHCAAYNGIGWENSKTRQAVFDTLGEIMTYNQRPINAVFSANSGGSTEDAKDVWEFDLPYLKAAQTLKEKDLSFPLEPFELKNWLRQKPESYSANGEFTNLAHYRWQRQVSKSFIETGLNIGELKELRIQGRGKGGSVKSLLVIGNKGQVELKTSLRSNLGGLRSNRFFFRPEYQAGQLVGYIFYGGGWGHGVGMDQAAAAGMAVEEKNYADILKHFYNGITIEKKY